MAEVKISELPSLTAVGISDETDVRIPIDDLQGAPTTKQLALSQLRLVLHAVTFSQTAIPSGSDPVGLYFVQTGDDRGVYAWTGTEAVQLAPFSIAGDWPI